MPQKTQILLLLCSCYLPIASPWSPALLSRAWLRWAQWSSCVSSSLRRENIDSAVSLTAGPLCFHRVPQALPFIIPLLEWPLYLLPYFYWVRLPFSLYAFPSCGWRLVTQETENKIESTTGNLKTWSAGKNNDSSCLYIHCSAFLHYDHATQ